jgi:hypothetical protein
VNQVVKGVLFGEKILKLRFAIEGCPMKKSDVAASTKVTKWP